MPKAIKKNPRIIKVSLSRGIAENTAVIKTLRPLTLEMVLRGLITLKVLKTYTALSVL